MIQIQSQLVNYGQINRGRGAYTIETGKKSPVICILFHSGLHDMSKFFFPVHVKCGYFQQCEPTWSRKQIKIGTTIKQVFILFWKVRESEGKLIWASSHNIIIWLQLKQRLGGILISNRSKNTFLHECPWKPKLPILPKESTA